MITQLKSNDIYSYFYDPKFTMQITINGQLFISMLSEEISNINNLTVLQVNTDGITVRIPKNKREEFIDICKRWEEITKYTLEYTNYQIMVIRDVI